MEYRCRYRKSVRVEITEDVAVNKDGGWEWRDVPSQDKDEGLLLWVE